MKINEEMAKYEMAPYGVSAKKRQCNRGNNGRMKAANEIMKLANQAENINGVSAEKICRNGEMAAKLNVVAPAISVINESMALMPRLAISWLAAASPGASLEKRNVRLAAIGGFYKKSWRLAASWRRQLAGSAANGMAQLAGQRQHKSMTSK